jgi:hypothetical protein
MLEPFIELIVLEIELKYRNSYLISLSTIERRVKTMEFLRHVTIYYPKGASKTPYKYADFKTLDSLHIKHVGITEMDLSFLPSLKYIDLSFNNLNSIKGLESLDLLSIDLQAVGLTKIPKMNSAVVNLNLSINNIKKIDNLENLTKLQYLNLSQNKIVKTGSLKHLIYLRILYLTTNKIKSINFKNLPLSLNMLWINDNELNDIVITALPVLTEIDLSWNKLRDIKDVDLLTSLESLNLRSNRFKSDLDLKSIPSLKRLVISN